MSRKLLSVFAITTLLISGCDGGVSQYEVSEYKHHEVKGNVMVLQEYSSSSVTPMQLNDIRNDGWLCVYVVKVPSTSRNDVFVFERIK